MYLAGPYTHPEPVANVHSMIKIADAIYDAGFVPLIPHLTLAWQLVSPKPYDTWLAYDLHLLARCDVLLRVHGHSRGADQECAFAESHGIPIVYSYANPSSAVRELMVWSDRVNH